MGKVPHSNFLRVPLYIIASGQHLVSATLETHPRCSCAADNFSKTWCPCPLGNDMSNRLRKAPRMPSLRVLVHQRILDENG